MEDRKKSKKKQKLSNLLCTKKKTSKIITWRGKVELLNPEQNSTGRKWGKKENIRNEKFNKNYLMNLKKTASAEDKLQIENGVRILYTHT